MDGRRFDAWTRRLAKASSRRGVLTVFAGAGIAGLATPAVVRADEACLEDGQFCTSDPDECCGVCVSFNCVDCVPKGGHGCENDDDCCGGKQECVHGVCKKRKKDVKCEANGCGRKKKKKKKKGGRH
jgi:hypothetical protein